MDKLTPGQLRDLADLIWSEDITPPNPPNNFYLVWSCLMEISEGLRNSAARREGEAKASASGLAPGVLRAAGEMLDIAATPPAADELVFDKAAADRAARALIPDAPDELVQRLDEYLIRLTKDKDRYTAEQLVMASKDRIEADARRIGELVGGHIDAQKQIGKATDRVEQLQKRVAKLEAALRRIRDQDQGCGGNLRPDELWKIVQKMADAALKGTANG